VLDTCPEDGQPVTETYRREYKTITLVYNLISAFVGVTFVNEIHINALHGTQNLQTLPFSLNKLRILLQVHANTYY
jgi:hypothetical protein